MCDYSNALYACPHHRRQQALKWYTISIAIGFKCGKWDPDGSAATLLQSGRAGKKNSRGVHKAQRRSRRSNFPAGISHVDFYKVFDLECVMGQPHGRPQLLVGG